MALNSRYKAIWKVADFLLMIAFGLHIYFGTQNASLAWAGVSAMLILMRRGDE